MGNEKWYKIDPKKEGNLFIAADLKYGNYEYKNDLRTPYLKKFKRLLGSFIENKKSKILVCGANSGQEIGALKKSSIFALDASKIALDKLYLRYPEVKTVVGDISTLPFEEKSFDYYVCMRAINSSTVNLTDALKEALRVVKNKGTIIISIPNGYIVKGQIQRGLYNYSKEDFDLREPYILSKKITNYLQKEKKHIKIVDFPSEIIIIAKP